MNKWKKMFFLFLFNIPSIVMYAQADTDNADLMRSNGKIYVVVAVVLVILFGLIIYLVNLDRKISKLEKQK